MTSFLQRRGTEPPNKIFRPLFGTENAGNITHGPKCGTTLHQQAPPIPKTAVLGYVGSEVEQHVSPLRKSLILCLLLSRKKK